MSSLVGLVIVCAVLMTMFLVYLGELLLTSERVLTARTNALFVLSSSARALFPPSL